MKILRFAAAGFAAALTLTACSSGSAGGSTDAEGGGSEGAEIRVWLVGSDTPQDARDYLKETFEEENPGSTLVIQEQSWTGLVDKLTTSLSGSDSPDVVEVGNTQAPTFTSAGYFAPLDDVAEDLGGDDLLPGFVESGTWEDTFYAAPYYAGSRVVFYSEQILGGAPVPTTLDEYVATATQARTDGHSGVWFPGQDWYNMLPFVWENGGFIAEQEGDQWEAGFSSEGGVAGLQQVQDLFQNASNAPKDGDETNLQVPFCEGATTFLSAPSWIKWSILAEADAEVPGCPETYGADLHAFPLPGKDGGAATVFAGGSNIAVAAKSANPDLATEALAIMLSDEYQTILAENGLIPAKVSLADALPDDEITAAAAAAAANARLTPATPKWGDVEAQKVMQDALVRIAQGEDVPTVAEELDSTIESILNG
ncbi:extracellular solute-binding protein [Cellulomonas shaoxiangyii]|uniref:Extracellular solute-binding protein n=1 Tax=Cellulomonas shaoxiangyii TaxID=2566013 RepID=A0A4V1CMT9_9CELL|nr:extracellular solute-binding protein [Cellulomonas shaoxiangyii]QCB94105.1 extracellular solute-binding protein [Cellulomonas shaoxiangyii]TGY77024.1 extracellular solute-binding protein [Cellulomonas shaoxiangyii]